MSDLFTHLVAARVPGVLVRDRRLVALLVIGTFLPDLASKGLYWILRSGEQYGIGTHSILGVLALSYLAALFVEEQLRRRHASSITTSGWDPLQSGPIIQAVVIITIAIFGTTPVAI